MIAQAASPVIAPDASGRYDLAPFIRGNGEAYLTRNNWAGDETMWTEDDSAAIWRLRKNGHSEEFGVTSAFIVRGIDDSPGNGAAYVLTNSDGSQGSPWSPRYMKVGDTFKRTAVVTFRDLKTGAQKASYTDVTWLKFAKFHTTWKSSQGLTVANVIELEAYSDLNSKLGKFVERYWYAYGLGLVGWQDSGIKIMGIVARPQNLPKTPRMQLSWYNGLVLPKTLISPADVRFKRHTWKAATAADFRFRSEPKAGVDYNIIRTIDADVITECDAIPRDLLTAAERTATVDGANTWHVCRLDGLVGYVRSDAGTVTLYAPPVEPPPPVPEPPDDERIKDTIVKLRQINRHAQECSRQAQELYTLTAIVLSAWEQLENVNPIGE